MSSIYRTVHVARITSRQVTQRSLAARVVYMHLLAGRATCRVPGLVVGDALALASETRLDAQVVADALVELVDHRLIEVDHDEQLIRVLGVAGDHAPAFRGPNNVDGLAAGLRELPDCPLRRRHAAELREACPAHLRGRLDPLCGPPAAPSQGGTQGGTPPPAEPPPDPVPDPPGHKEQEQEQEDPDGLTDDAGARVAATSTVKSPRAVRPTAETDRDPASLARELLVEISQMFTPTDDAGRAVEQRRIRTSDRAALARVERLLEVPLEGLDEAEAKRARADQFAYVRTTIEAFAAICRADPAQAAFWGPTMLSREPGAVGRGKARRSAWEVLESVVAERAAPRPKPGARASPGAHVVVGSDRKYSNGSQEL